MRFTKTIATLCLTASMYASSPQPEPQPQPEALPQAEQTPSQVSQPVTPAQPKAKKKKSGKGKWIAIGAVGAAVVVTLVFVEKRLNNEGAGIFH